MRVAFYAPLKSPVSPTPSGDRMIARMFVAGLEHCGHEVAIASHLRSFDPIGHGARQARIANLGRRLASRLVRRLSARPRLQRPQIWFTYHLYHKAPDWIGPQVAKALNIPYVVAEASLAEKQRHGPWSEGHARVEATLERSDLVIGLNSRDREGVMGCLSTPDRYAHLSPFIDCAPYVEATQRSHLHRQRLGKRFGLKSGAPILLCAAMMRDGRKADSFQLLASALNQVRDYDWQLLIVGDGQARAEVEQAFRPLANRVIFAGLAEPRDMPGYYAGADIFVWPAIEEPLGMCFLEAQATGVPVIGANVRGVPDLVRHGQTGLLAEHGDAASFARCVQALLTDEGSRGAMAREAKSYALAQHDLESQAPILSQLLDECVRRFAQPGSPANGGGGGQRKTCAGLAGPAAASGTI